MTKKSTVRRVSVNRRRRPKKGTHHGFVRAARALTIEDGIRVPRYGPPLQGRVDIVEGTLGIICGGFRNKSGRRKVAFLRHGGLWLVGIGAGDYIIRSY